MTVYRWYFDTDHDARQSLAVERARGKHDEAVRLAEALPDVSVSRHKAQALRLDRCELILEAMFRFMEDKGHTDREEFARYIRMVDLEDGMEDGRMGPDRSEKAPKCPSCQKPHNPTRFTCLYCGTDIPLECLVDMKPLGEYRYVVCISCYRRLPEDQTTATIEGPICRRCHK